MSTQEIKTSIIQAINSTDDIGLLREIGHLVKIDVNEVPPIKLKQWQIDEINIASKQFENGEYLSHKEAQKECEEWLKD